MTDPQSRYRVGNAMVGELPNDFLTLGNSNNLPAQDPTATQGPATQTSQPSPTSAPESRQAQLTADEQLARQLQAEESRVGAPATGAPYAQYPGIPTTIVTKLRITITQAKLVKNYGLVSMDPYCRVRVANTVVMSRVAYSGGKNPVWNDVILCVFPPGADSFLIDLFDEKTFSTDERIAWAHIVIPPEVFTGQSVNHWFDLNGKQGDGKEGQINIILKLEQHQIPLATVYPAAYPTYPVGYPPMVAPGMPMMIPHGYPLVPAPGGQHAPPGAQAPPSGSATATPTRNAPVPVPAPPPPRPVTDEDVSKLCEMFPHLPSEQVRATLIEKRGNMEDAVSALLQPTVPLRNPAAGSSEQC